LKEYEIISPYEGSQKKLPFPGRRSLNNRSKMALKAGNICIYLPVNTLDATD
jgi:hypothetical protein